MRPDRECDSRTVCTEAGRNSFHPHQKRNRRIYTGEDGQMKIVAVVFDMDGVLFDTERIGVQSWTEAAEPTGFANAYEVCENVALEESIPGTKEVFMAEAEKQGIVLVSRNCMPTAADGSSKRRRGTGCRRSRGYMKSSNIFMRKRFLLHWHLPAKKRRCSVIWRSPGSPAIFRRSLPEIWSRMVSHHRISI